MLDPRVYRAGFVPVLFVLVVVAFSLRAPARPLAASLPAQAFDGAAAMATLRSLGADPALRDRRPAAVGDDALAGRVAAALRRRRFEVSQRRFAARTAVGRRTVTAVVGERVGFSNRRVVVVAPRDAVRGPATAQLSGTAALLELARVLGGRTLGRTLELVSISGTEGGAGTADLARHLGGPVEAVIVLGDLAGRASRKPWVVPFGSSAELAPLRLRTTVETAVRAETGESPGGVHPLTQWARLAFPVTLGAQGPLLARDVPAVLLGPGGERGDPGDEGVSPDRLQAFGRAALESVTALDAGRGTGTPARYVVVAHKVLPAWAVRLLVAALILPALIAAIDGFARARRRREPMGAWLRWVLAGVAPFVLVVLFLRALAAVGLLPASPPGPVVAGVIPLDTSAAVVLGAAAATLLLGWLALRPLLLRVTRAQGDAAAPGSAAALVLVLCAAAVVAWAVNPFAAALLVPALHFWLLAVAPEDRPSAPVGLGLVFAGLVAPILVAVSYAAQFGFGPLDELWSGTLLVAGGGVSLPAALGWSVVLGCAAGVVVAVLAASRRRTAAAEDVSVRGPASYAGPGSLGGTESALRR